MLRTSDTLHLTALEFTETFRRALPGDHIVYAIGNLASARYWGKRNGEPEAEELEALVSALQRRQRLGELSMVQRRVAAGHFEYRATKAGRRREDTPPPAILRMA